ncbi:MAG: hypothetical protein GXO79_10350 [Chlorobi bacterium]|nr:hypothetical protein [Chlorobiota bacterium]
MNRLEIEKALLKNAEFISKENEQEIKLWNGLVLSKDKLFIPGYIPYIGSEYLGSRPKIINYALSQNLHPDYNFVIRYANNWKTKNNIEEALNRQNTSFKNSGMVQMHPFDTGHLPILSGILIYLTTKEINIDPLSKISATNLSKFSFRDGNNYTTDDEISLNKCYDWFTKKELETLNPDYIICAGDRVFNIIKQGNNSNPILVKFPSLQVINGLKKPLTSNDEKKLKLIISIFSSEFLNRKSSYKNKKKLIDIIKRDGYYFVKMFESIERQIEKYGV